WPVPSENPVAPLAASNEEFLSGPRPTMKRLFLPLLLLVAIAIAVAAAWYVVERAFSGRAPAHGGAVVSETRPLEPFSRLGIDGLAEVTLVQGTTEAITIEAPAKQMTHVGTDVSDGTLTISSAGGSRGFLGSLFRGGARPAKVTITFRTLDGIRASGAVKLRTEGLKTQALAVDVSGAASLLIAGLDAKALSFAGSGATKTELSGRVGDQKVSISGAGDYRAQNLLSDTARIAVSGAGKVIVNAAKTLDVSISGAGSVDYLGNPQVSEQISGAGRVRRRESALGHSAIAGSFAPSERGPRAVSERRSSRPAESYRA
ncbi:MAG TPA: head GIN domain-containing protein, partial [Casimicrobiaceae bacterium]